MPIQMPTNSGERIPAMKRWFLAVSCLSLICSASAEAQVRGYPKNSYYLAKREFYAGEYRDAERGFQQALRGGSLRVGAARWIDSICYYTMLGELSFHRGQLQRSLELHELAIAVHLANPNWMVKLRYPPLKPASRVLRAPIAWGQRATIRSELPDSIHSFEGNVDLEQPFRTGGVVNTAHTRKIDASEVVRCLAVSMKRRAELLGFTATLSAQSSKITDSFAGIAMPVGHWAANWVEVLYGLALLGDGKSDEAAAHLRKGATAGNFDHVLTGIALLELGRLKLRAEDYGAATKLFQQASLAAARYEQPEVIEDSLRLLTDAFLANEAQGFYPPIAPIVVYAERERDWRLAAL